MAQFCRRATELLKEVVQHSETTIPPYNEEVVRQVFNEVEGFNAHSEQTISDVREKVEDEGPRGGEEEEVQEIHWADHPEAAVSLVIVHECIKRNKRLLLTYMKIRAQRLLNLRWSSLQIPDDVKDNLSPAEVELFRKYSDLLVKYFSPGTGIGMDLTLDISPPKDPFVEVRALEDSGDVTFSIGRVVLRRGTIYYLPRDEVEPLIKEGVLEVTEMHKYL